MDDRERQELLSLIKDASVRIDSLQAEIDRLNQARHEPIAVIGIGCRFPGGMTTPERFWHALCQGTDAIVEVPPERWDVDSYYDPDPAAPGKMHTRHGGFLDHIDTFEPQFFRLSPRETRQLDPQQRLLLEVSWEALEAAGIPPTTLLNSPTGVFVGISGSEYADVLARNGLAELQSDLYASTRTATSVAAGRLAYTLGLKGPCLAVDTACSSSLVSVHQACQSLRQGECDLALAGGVGLILQPETTIAFSKAGMLAPDGRCKTFDAAANGYVRGDGCGMVVLKRLQDAYDAREPILALIRGSMINHDGRSSDLTVPNGLSQQTVIRRALKNAQVEPAAVSYVEAHGTGTALGDPIEIGALGAVFSQRPESLWVGSVKTNIGHLEAAAGIAGLIKVVLMLQHAQIPPHLNFHTPSPHIDWDQLPIKVPTALIPWQAEERIAGVSSFGYSGTNAHIVLAQAPSLQTVASEVERPWHLLTLSARTEGALSQLAEQYQDIAAQASPRLPLADACYTASTGRSHFPYRLSCTAASWQQVQEQLQTWTSGQVTSGIAQGQPSADDTPAKVAFMFTGQGSQYVDMGRQLYDTHPGFRDTLEHCHELLRPHLDQPLLDVLYPTNTDTTVLLSQTAYTQPALFALEYALAKLWQSWGITPDVVIGHSVGEYVAACLAGVFSLEAGLNLIAARGRLMQALPETGAMVAVMTDEARVRDAMGPFTGEVDIAAVNGPHSVVISGERSAVKTIVEQLTAHGIRSQTLTVSHAFHSPLMEPMLRAFEQIARTIHYTPPHIPLVSNLTGKEIRDEMTDPMYWVQHVRSAVRFADGMRTLGQRGVGVFLEVGPRPTLLSLGQRCLELSADPDPSASPAWLPSLRQGRKDWQQMLSSLGELYVRGAEIDWARFDQPYERRKVVLPTYPFQRQRYWTETASRKARPREALRPLLDKMIDLPLQQQTVFETEFSLVALPFLNDYQLYGRVVAPAACHLAMVLSGMDAKYEPSACALEEITFPAPLVVPPIDRRTVQVALTHTTDQAAAREFQLISLANADTDAPPLIHATGRFSVQAPGSSHVNTVSVSSPEALQSQFRSDTPCPLQASAATVSELVLGPYFQWLETFWLGQNEALGKLQLPAALGSLQGYLLHPGLLTACFQVVEGFLNAAHHADETAGQPSDSVWWPVRIAAVHLYHGIEGTAWWCHAQQLDPDRWNLQVLDRQGQLVADLLGVDMQPVSPDDLPSDAWPLATLWRDWLYTLRWQPKLLSTKPVLPAQGSWLIVDRPDGLGAELAKQLQAQGRPCVCVTFQQFLQDIQEANLSPYQGVIYMGTPHSGTKDTDIPETVHHLCGELLNLAQALIERETDLAPRLWVITQNSQAVGQTPAALQVEQAPLWGLARTIMAEYPQLRCSCIDLEERPSADLIPLLLTELQADDTENQIAYRQGRRYAARLSRWQPPYRSSAEEGLALREDGSYLITGGLGGLGLQVARQMVAQGARHLVLSGRRGVTSDLTRKQIEQLEHMGATVQVVPADVSQAEQVAQLLAACQATAPLKGLIHAAGVVDHDTLSQQTLERFAAVMAPKVRGAWRLHQLSQDLDLDFFICFSSLSALLETFNVSSYAAANAFLDALVHQRQAMGLPGLSLNWGPWADVGMAAGSDVQMREIGMQLIPSEAGAQLLLALGCQHNRHLELAQIAVAGVHWPQFHQQLFQNRACPFLSELIQPAAAQNRPRGSLRRRQQLDQAAPHERVQLLTSYLQEEVAQMLGLSQPPLLKQHFIDMGIDSLMAVDLRNRLETGLALSLSATLFFKYRNIEDLATYLAKACDEDASSTDASQSPVEPVLPGSEDRLPLFFVPGAGGDPIYLYELARYFHPSQPLYSFRPVGFDGEAPPHTTVEETASCYAQAILSVQAQGPYLLAGHSSGAYVAFGIAQYLMQQGHEISLLAILDVSAPIARTLPDWLEDWDDVESLLVYAYLWEHASDKALHLSRETLQHLDDEALAYAFKSAMEQVDLMSPDTDIARVQGILKVFKASVTMSVRYVTEDPRALPIVFLRAEKGECQGDGDWGEIGPTEICVVPGDHLTMMFEPHAAVLAEQLETYLSSLQVENKD